MEQNFEGKIPDSILAKLQKLQALANGEGTTEAEMQNAMAKFSDILVKYNIDESMVNAHKPKAESDIVIEGGQFDDFYDKGNDYKDGRIHDGEFGINLMRAIARVNFCEMLHTNLKNKRIRDEKGLFIKTRTKGLYTLIGTKQNIAVTLYMFEYAFFQIKVIFRKHRADKRSMGQEFDSRMVYRRSYYEGAVEAIKNKLNAQRREQYIEYGESMTALVKTSSELVSQKMHQAFPRIRYVNTKTYGSDAGKAAGYKDGSKIDFKKGLGGTATPSGTKQLGN